MGKAKNIKRKKMEHQNWGESWVVPKNTGDRGKQSYNSALGGNVTAVTRVQQNKMYTGANHDAKKYAQIMESEDTHVDTVGHDVKIAIQKARQAKGWNQRQLAEAISAKADVIRDYENGKAIPDNALIAKIEKVTGVKLPRAPKKKKNYLIQLVDV